MSCLLYVAYSSSGGYRAAMISVVSRTIMNKIGCRVISTC